jgi:glycosyltransferase involved in cell wall biosynthesis
MLKILINSYACSPGMGSEPGMAWNWCIHLAKYCELHIITEGEFTRNIETELPKLPQSKNMTFYYNPVSEEVRKMCWNQGDWRFYYHYQKWQKSVLQVATDIVSKEKIDVIHHLNMIGFREPGYLWKIETVPFILGPINAKESVPISYLNDSNWKQKLFLNLKNSITKLQLRYSRRVRLAITSARYTIASSSDSARSIEKYFGIRPVLINESGCDTPTNTINSVKKSAPSDTFNILWVGRFIFTKQLKLALDTIASLKHLNIRFHVVGGEEAENSEWMSYSKRAGIEDICIWHGKVSHERVQKLMGDSELFFFTSIAEGTPHVVLEALANNLPVLCFDTCGQGDTVNASVGIKIPLTNPNDSIREFANKITLLERDRDLLRELSENCAERRAELTWERKVKEVIELYKTALPNRTKSSVINV